MDRNKEIKKSCKHCYWSFIVILVLVFIMLCTGCMGPYYLTDSEYSDVRESHASVTYYDNQIYWGWHSGYYYYYGTPHYYPWYYYYNACPPSHYTHTTHVIITRPVNRPNHRPNRPNKPKVNTYVNKNINKSNVIRNTNKNRTNTKVNVNKNRNNRTNTNRRKPR